MRKPVLLLLSEKPWNKGLKERLSQKINYDIRHIKDKNDLTVDLVLSIKPEWIMVPHWSHIIKKEIWESSKTVIFHMTDLPYGRGGSPLQNLIKRGHKHTVISALQCREEMDAGDIYFKENLDLHGTAEEIFIRADRTIENMIIKLVCENPIPVSQSGDVTRFVRRKPSQSNLSECQDGDLCQWYDHIRMLDAEGYPHAFLEANGMKLEFRRVSRRKDGLHADVVIKTLL